MGDQRAEIGVFGGSGFYSFLEHTDEAYYTDSVKQLEENAMFTCERVNSIPGLQAIVPAGTMYVMVRTSPSGARASRRACRARALTTAAQTATWWRQPAHGGDQVRIDLAAFRDIADDMAFSEKLVQEQSVFVLPGQVRRRAGWRARHLCVSVCAS